VFFYVLLVVPLISLILGGSSVIAAIAKKRHGSLAMLSMLVSYWAISAVLVMNYSAMRASARWLIWSHEYKSEVLAQATPSNGELKHIAWDGWGFPGAGDTTVYLVFDPTDALSAAPRAIALANSVASPARCRLYVVWRAIGTPFYFIPMNGGAKTHWIAAPVRKLTVGTSPGHGFQRLQAILRWQI
jgi:hypothetical protein